MEFVLSYAHRNILERGNIRNEIMELGSVGGV